MNVSQEHKEKDTKLCTPSIEPYEINKIDILTKRFDTLHERQPGVDTEKAYDETLEERQSENFINNEKLDINCIIDKPKTFIREYLHEERKRNNSVKLRFSNKKNKENSSTTHKTHKTHKKCYTCFPRKQVKNHIIQTTNGITFHHDMCNRSMIIATPDKHYSKLDEIDGEEIGNMFKTVTNFCNDWNILDYSMSYNQGEWQTHKHFHIKIKSHDKLIKRMRGDHFRMVNLKNEYNS